MGKSTADSNQKSDSIKESHLTHNRAKFLESKKRLCEIEFI